MVLYNLDVGCPRCGKLHRVIGGPWGGLMIEHGPDRPGTIAELYESRELAAVLVRLLNGKVWCDQAGDYVLMDDPARIHLPPRSGT